MVALLVLLLLTANISEYKLVIVPVVEANVVIAPDGVFNDGNCAFPELFISHELFELDVFIWPNTLELL